jgi:hypothetical protein
MLNAMTIEITIALIALVAFFTLRWSFRHLPEERWQFFAVLPVARDGEGWQGVNITYYGVISALAYGVSIALFIFLCGAANQPSLLVMLFVVALLSVAIPASKWIAYWVEGSRATFTVGGALFITAMCAPILFYSVNAVGGVLGIGGLHAPSVVAAATLSYCLGEAIGRLGCLSFGCCYGKQLNDAGPIERLLYGASATTYRGRLKKISYASNLESIPVIAVQSVASVVLFALFLFGLWLFWLHYFSIALIVTLVGSQLWRLYSETLRADYRGDARFTAYQKMAIVTLLVTLAVSIALSNVASVSLNAQRGFDALLRVEVLLSLQIIFIAIVYFMGRSTVTGAHLQMRLFRDRL